MEQTALQLIKDEKTNIQEFIKKADKYMLAFYEAVIDGKYFDCLDIDEDFDKYISDNGLKYDFIDTKEDCCYSEIIKIYDRNNENDCVYMPMVKINMPHEENERFDVIAFDFKSASLDSFADMLASK